MVVKSDRGSLLVKGAALALGVELGAPIALVVAVSTDDAVDAKVGADINEVEYTIEVVGGEGDADNVVVN